MGPQRRGDQVTNISEFSGSGRCKTGKIILPMATRKQEERADDDRLDLLVDASPESLFNGRIGKLHMCGLDDLEFCSFPENGDKMIQQVIALLTSGPMVHNHDPCCLKFQNWTHSLVRSSREEPAAFPETFVSGRLPAESGRPEGQQFSGQTS